MSAIENMVVQISSRPSATAKTDMVCQEACLGYGLQSLWECHSVTKGSCIAQIARRFRGEVPWTSLAKSLASSLNLPRGGRRCASVGTYH